MLEKQQIKATLFYQGHANPAAAFRAAKIRAERIQRKIFFRNLIILALVIIIGLLTQCQHLLPA